MGKTLIKVNCIDQRLFIASSPVIASGGRNENEVEFNFCALWDDYEKTAVFFRDKSAVYHVPIVDDKCVIPHEVIASEGWMYFGVFGVSGDIRRTSDVMKYHIAKGAITEGGLPTDPTSDVYKRYLDSLAKMEQATADVETAINAVNTAIEATNAATQEAKNAEAERVDAEKQRAETFAGFAGEINRLSEEIAVQGSEISGNRLLSSTLLRNTTKISNFDTDEWVQVSAESTGALTDDTVHAKFGAKSLRITVNAGQQLSIEYLPENDIAVQDMLVFFRAFIENVANLDRIVMYFGTTGTGLSDYLTLYGDRLVDGWNTQVVSYAQIVMETQKMPLEHINWVRVNVKAKSSGSVNVYADTLSLVKNTMKKGSVVLAFDDGHESVYNFAKPVLDKYGFRGVVYAIRDLVGRTNYMTLEQLRTLYDNGWDVATHSQRRLSDYTNPEDIREELLRNRDYLIDNGFVDSAYHFASHQGNYNDMALAEIKKLFRTHRTTVFGYATLPIVDRYQILNLGGNNSELSWLKTVADYIEAGKYCAFMNWHHFADSATDSLTADVAVFDEFLAYIKSKDIDVVTVSDIFGGNMVG